MITLSNIHEFSDRTLDNYIVLDLETSGLDRTHDRVIYAEALLIRNGEIVNEFRRLANPGFLISDAAIELVGITNEELSIAQSTDEVIDDFLSFIGNNVCVSYSALFDNRVLTAELNIRNLDTCPAILCLLKTAKYLFPDLERYSSEGLAEHFECLDVTLENGRLDYVKRFNGIFKALEKQFSYMLGGSRPVIGDYMQIRAFI